MSIFKHISILTVDLETGYVGFTDGRPSIIHLWILHCYVPGVKKQHTKFQGQRTKLKYS